MATGDKFEDIRKPNAHRWGMVENQARDCAMGRVPRKVLKYKEIPTVKSPNVEYGYGLMVEHPSGYLKATIPTGAIFPDQSQMISGVFICLKFLNSRNNLLRGRSLRRKNVFGSV